MTPFAFIIAVAALSFVGAFLGPLFRRNDRDSGMDPVAGIDIRPAIGASIISVIATSSGAAAAYERDKVATTGAGG